MVELSANADVAVPANIAERSKADIITFFIFFINITSFLNIEFIVTYKKWEMQGIKYDNFYSIRHVFLCIINRQTGNLRMFGEIIYLCKFQEFDEFETISFEIGCTKKIYNLRKDGTYLKYKNHEGDY